MSRDDTLEAFSRATWGSYHGELRVAWVEERAAIMAALESADHPLTLAEIAQVTGLDGVTARDVLLDMIGRSLVVSYGGPCNTEPTYGLRPQR